MESRNKLTMCRLCLSENECFINIFEMNDWQGFVAAEVISDLLQFKVSESDGYPHVVCSTCITKLTDFKLFKEFCLKSKVTYDKMFILSDSLVMHQTVMDEVFKFQISQYSSATVNPTPSNDEVISSDLITSGTTFKVEPLEVEEFEFPESDNLSKDAAAISTKVEEISYDILSETIMKEEPVQEASLGGSGLELCEEDPLKDASSHVDLTLAETMKSNFLQCLEDKRSHSTTKKDVNPDSCTLSISTNHESMFERTENISMIEGIETSSSEVMERLEEQRIFPGERVHVTPLVQQDISIGKELEVERGKVEEDIEGNNKGLVRTVPEKRLREKREGLKCFHCGIVLMSKHGLVKHMKVHGFVNSYDCAVCGKIFCFNYELKRHVLTHTKSKPYKCAVCSKCFNRNGNLKIHMQVHAGSKLYNCSECSKCFSRNDYLKKHIKRRHTGHKPYQCSECNKCFCESSDLKIHMRKHTGFKPYKCAECSKCFIQNGDLQRHLGTHAGYKPYKCPVCSKTFSRYTGRRKHMISHTDSKPDDVSKV